jgi:hypothetical protein
MEAVRKPRGRETSAVVERYQSTDEDKADGEERMSQPQSHSAAGKITSCEKANVFIGNGTRDLPGCSIVPQPIMLLRFIIISISFIISV